MGVIRHSPGLHDSSRAFEYKLLYLIDSKMDRAHCQIIQRTKLHEITTMFIETLTFLNMTIVKLKTSNGIVYLGIPFRVPIITIELTEFLALTARIKSSHTLYTNIQILAYRLSRRIRNLNTRSGRAPGTTPSGRGGGEYRPPP